MTLRIFDPKNEIDFVGMLGWAVKLGVIIPIVSIIGLSVLGIRWGLDFSGGTEMQVKFSKPVSSSEVREVLAGANFDKNQVQQYGDTSDNEMLIRVERFTSLKDSNVDAIKKVLADNFETFRFGSAKGKEDIEVSFRVEEGDRRTELLF